MSYEKLSKYAYLVDVIVKIWYFITEIIYTEGFEYQDKVYYKLTELEQINESEDQEENK